MYPMYSTLTGKGELQTYWAFPRLGLSECNLHASCRGSSLQVCSKPSSVASSRLIHGTIADASGLDDRKKRSVHWISEIMLKLLKQIAARRAVGGWHIPGKNKKLHSRSASEQFSASEEVLVVDELQDIITLPRFDKSLARKQADSSKIKLPEAATSQLQNYISWVALIYRDNPFHNMDHAAHVTMSVSKLLTRIVAPETLDPAKESGRTFEARRHDHT